ncbi:DUF6093 family protein [Streptomyces sp. AC1-42T]|uniref:DUF6093 family protein n=1 Tax=Streptomyces sp. AC1-42T TaxID=2218665 RepID=UPI000DAD825D|nr:DUF6093 family protein [Streptomyces sp. AC1-42T]PZT71506.1 hypothetical protein DNK55_32870 [Streptomyces sp. AC1-42T]
MKLLDLRALGQFVEELVMGDTVRITRPAGPPVLNPSTGDLEEPPPLVLYEGAGAVLDGSAAPGIIAPVAGQPYEDDPKNPYKLLTPVDAPVAARDDTIRVLRAAYDPALVGRTWRCTQPGQASTIIAVRVTWLDENNPPGAP